jgi:hypothetical protein
MIKETWTQRDEALFQESVTRRQRVMEMNRAPVMSAARALACLSQSDIADMLIANADSIRDALAPYDSGVRPEVAEGSKT